MTNLPGRLRRYARRAKLEPSLAAVEASTVWVLGSPRSGTTWLLNLLGRLDERVVMIDEPGIGTHLGVFVSDSIGAATAVVPTGEVLFNEARAGQDDYLFSDRDRDSWEPHLRSLILSRTRATLVAAGKTLPASQRIALIKEPNGSQSAVLISRVLPRSKLLFVLRDGRDVVDSMLDAMTNGGWLAESYGRGRPIQPGERLDFIERQARRWVARTSAVEAAFARHDPALCLRIRYEDLLADTPRVLDQAARWLGLNFTDDAVQRVTEELAFKEVSGKGSGKFHRAATPGLWRRNLSSKEQAAMTDIMAGALARFGYEKAPLASEVVGGA